MSAQGFKRTLFMTLQILPGLVVMNLAYALKNPAPDPAAVVAAFAQLDEHGLRSPNSMRAASARFSVTTM